MVDLYVEFMGRFVIAAPLVALAWVVVQKLA